MKTLKLPYALLFVSLGCTAWLIRDPALSRRILGADPTTGWLWLGGIVAVLYAAVVLSDARRSHGLSAFDPKGPLFLGFIIYLLGAAISLLGAWLWVAGAEAWLLRGLAVLAWAATAAGLVFGFVALMRASSLRIAILLQPVQAGGASLLIFAVLMVAGMLSKRDKSRI